METGKPQQQVYFVVLFQEGCNDVEYLGCYSSHDRAFESYRRHVEKLAENEGDCFWEDCKHDFGVEIKARVDGRVVQKEPLPSFGEMLPQQRKAWQESRRRKKRMR